MSSESLENIVGKTRKEVEQLFLVAFQKIDAKNTGMISSHDFQHCLLSVSNEASLGTPMSGGIVAHHTGLERHDVVSICKNFEDRELQCVEYFDFIGEVFRIIADVLIKKKEAHKRELAEADAWLAQETSSSDESVSEEVCLVTKTEVTKTKTAAHTIKANSKVALAAAKSAIMMVQQAETQIIEKQDELNTQILEENSKVALAAAKSAAMMVQEVETQIRQKQNEMITQILKENIEVAFAAAKSAILNVLQAESEINKLMIQENAHTALIASSIASVAVESANKEIMKCTVKQNARISYNASKNALFQVEAAERGIATLIIQHNAEIAKDSAKHAIEIVGLAWKTITQQNARKALEASSKAVIMLQSAQMEINNLIIRQNAKIALDSSAKATSMVSAAENAFIQLIVREAVSIAMDATRHASKNADMAEKYVRNGASQLAAKVSAMALHDANNEINLASTEISLAIAKIVANAVLAAFYSVANAESKLFLAQVAIDQKKIEIFERQTAEISAVEAAYHACSCASNAVLHCDLVIRQSASKYAAIASAEAISDSNIELDVMILQLNKAIEERDKSKKACAQATIQAKIAQKQTEENKTLCMNALRDARLLRLSLIDKAKELTQNKFAIGGLIKMQRRFKYWVRIKHARLAALVAFTAALDAEKAASLAVMAKSIVSQKFHSHRLKQIAYQNARNINNNERKQLKINLNKIEDEALEYTQTETLTILERRKISVDGPLFASTGSQTNQIQDMIINYLGKSNFTGTRNTLIAELENRVYNPFFSAPSTNEYIERNQRLLPLLQNLPMIECKLRKKRDMAKLTAITSIENASNCLTSDINKIKSLPKAMTMKCSSNLKYYLDVSSDILQGRIIGASSKGRFEILAYLWWKLKSSTPIKRTRMIQEIVTNDLFEIRRGLPRLHPIVENKEDKNNNLVQPNSPGLMQMLLHDHCGDGAVIASTLRLVEIIAREPVGGKYFSSVKTLSDFCEAAKSVGSEPTDPTCGYCLAILNSLTLENDVAEHVSACNIIRWITNTLESSLGRMNQRDVPRAALQSVGLLANLMGSSRGRFMASRDGTVTLLTTCLLKILEKKVSGKHFSNNLKIINLEWVLKEMRFYAATTLYRMLFQEKNLELLYKMGISRRLHKIFTSLTHPFDWCMDKYEKYRYEITQSLALLDKFRRAKEAGNREMIEYKPKRESEQLRHLRQEEILHFAWPRISWTAKGKSSHLNNLLMPRFSKPEKYLSVNRLSYDASEPMNSNVPKPANIELSGYIKKDFTKQYDVALWHCKICSLSMPYNIAPKRALCELCFAYKQEKCQK